MGLDQVTWGAAAYVLLCHVVWYPVPLCQVAWPLFWYAVPCTNMSHGLVICTYMSRSLVPFPSMKYGMLPFDMENGGIGGGIAEGPGFEPSAKGSLIYLNGGEDLNTSLNKVESAGGKIVLPKTSIGANGFMAHFIDTEGNKVAFHSPK